VLYRLALDAQSLFTAAACLGRRDELVLPGGDSAADLVSATLLKLLAPFNTSVTWSPTKGPPTTAEVLAYSREVLKRDFLDLVRSKDRNALRRAFTRMTREPPARTYRNLPRSEDLELLEPRR
jgi:hypothetical protein